MSTTTTEHDHLDSSDHRNVQALAARIRAVISTYISPQLSFHDEVRSPEPPPNDEMREFLENISRDFLAQLDADLIAEEFGVN